MANTQAQTYVKTGEVRFAFCHLFEPYAFDEAQDPKYSVNILIPKNDKATLAAIQRAYNAAKAKGIEKNGKAFGAKVNPLKRAPGADKGMLIDCDEDDRYSDNEDMAGHYMMSLKSKTAPVVLARETGTKHLDPSEGPDIVYSGCYGKVSMNLYPYNKIATGIAAGLNNVFKTRDGEYMGGRTSAESDFADELNDDSVMDLNEDDDFGL